MPVMQAEGGITGRWQPVRGSRTDVLITFLDNENFQSNS